MIPHEIIGQHEQLPFTQFCKDKCFWGRKNNPSKQNSLPPRQRTSPYKLSGVAWHGELRHLTHGKQARDTSELGGEVKLLPQRMVIGELWLMVKTPWIKLIFANSLSWVHEVSVLPNLSPTSSLCIACNSTPEFCLKPDPAPHTASTDLSL